MANGDKDGALSAWEMLEIAVSGANGSEEVDLVSLARNAAAEARAMAAALQQGRPMHGSTNPDAIKPVAHLVWLQGRRAADDVEDYYEVARPGDKCADGSDPFPVYSSEQMEALEAERDELRAGIKRLSDEEELCAETSGEDPFSLVYLAARLEQATCLAKTMEAEANQMREVSIANRHRAEEAKALLAEAISALEFYANPEVYRPHPHGPAFDRRDLSYHARDALLKLQDHPHE